MRTGAMRRRITLQSRDATVDANGGQVTSWTNVATVWASIEPLSVRELLAAQSVQSEISHKITLRYQPALASMKALAAMRALYGTRIFSIAGGMNLDERNRELDLLATESLNNG
jgi:SPP1 family predicted phage head-tail adaptor